MERNLFSLKNKKLIILFFFILLKFVFQYALISEPYELHRDEFLHIDQGKHLAWGYISLPPLTSWFSYLIILLGKNEFWVRFFPALFGALTIYVSWKIVEELKGGLYALILASSAVLFSALLRLNILYQPNSFDVLCWVLVFYFIIKFINTQRNVWLYILAFTIGIGFLNKYTIVFLIMAIIPALAISEHRKVFKNINFYLSIALTFIIISPNLYWQYQNDFPVFTHLSVLEKTQLSNIGRLVFLKEQVLFFINSIFLLVGAFIGFFRHQPFNKYRIIFYSFILALLIFIYFNAKGYYSIGLYPVLLSFGAVYMEQLLNRYKKAYLKPAFIIIIPLIFLPVIPYAFPVKSPLHIKANNEKFESLGMLTWEDGKTHELPQDFADMLGWKELAGIVSKAYEASPDKEHTLVLCDNYGQAGAINFYSNNDFEAVSMNADYINWFNLNKEIKHVILVKEANSQDKERKREKAFFKSVEKVGEVGQKFSREKGTEAFFLKDAVVSINEILEEEINRRNGFPE